MNNDLQFTVDSALLRELGEKLVETVHLALAELVKNAYDADATLVELIFSKDSSGRTQIIVMDNGVGMNFSAIKDYWMRVATTNKVEKKYSKVFGRPLSGAKGIGRFSCRRLGSHLKIITKGTKDGNIVGQSKKIQKTVVEFPWEKFKPGEDLTTIKCPGSQEEIKDNTTGTHLIISSLADEWTFRGYTWLQRQLAVLAANRGAKRKGFQEDPGFNIKILAPDFDSGEILDVRSKLMKAGWGTLKAEINSKQQAVCQLQAMGIGKRVITSAKIFPNLKDISLELAIMVHDRDLIRDTKILSLGTLENILNDWGGVQVRYKEIRVYPYGDDDWLNIDKERGLRKGTPNTELFAFAETLRGVDPGRSLLNMLSMKSYVGNVEIGEDAVGFEPKLSREGFVSNSSISELVEFVRFAIDWSTILRDFYIRQESLKLANLAKERFEESINQQMDADQVVDTALSHLKLNVAALAETLPQAQRKKFEIEFETATDVIKKQYDSNQVELAHLRLIASTSTLLLIFSHEVRTLLGILERSKNSLEILADQLATKQKKEVKEITVEFTELKTRLGELLSMTSLVGRDNRKIKPGFISLLERVKKVEKVFELITNKYEIDIDHKGISNSITIKNILEAEVYSLLLNVISNSIKAVIAVGTNDRRIQLTAERNNGFNIITIRDSGLGLSADRFEEVFIPFISDPDGKLYRYLDRHLNPEDNSIVGTGSGLGLGIVREIVRAHGGTVKFQKPTKGWNTELQIRLP